MGVFKLINKFVVNLNIYNLNGCLVTRFILFFKNSISIYDYQITIYNLKLYISLYLYNGWL